MEGIPAIKIECQGATIIGLDELQELHHFKITSDVQYAQCRNSLTELGFSFPFFIWVDKETGTKWTVDGHRRLYTLKRMRDEGVPLPKEFPADFIFAKDKQEAAKKVVANESRYGDPDPEDFADFLTDNEIDIGDLDGFMNIPDFDITPEGTSPVDPEEPKKKDTTVVCPNCQYLVTIKP